MILNLSHGRGSPHLLKISISPLQLWVFSTIYGKKITKKKQIKLSTKNFNTKGFNTFKNKKKWLNEKNNSFLLLC
jgi:hypothetical protein